MHFLDGGAKLPWSERLLVKTAGFVGAKFRSTDNPITHHDMGLPRKKQSRDNTNIMVYTFPISPFGWTK